MMDLKVPTRVRRRILLPWFLVPTTPFSFVEGFVLLLSDLEL